MNNPFNLESVRLINYKYHIDTTIPFTDGLNLITGETGTGKSCAFDGLLWVYGFSPIAENDFRREGTDSTSVIIKLSSGFEVERVRSNSLNRYILRKENCETRTFDNINREVPLEVRQVLGIEELCFDKIPLNVNFASQDDLNFLFDKKIPASFNAKLFNYLTGNSILDSLFAVCNKEKLSISKEIENLNTSIIKQKENVENCTKTYTELNAKLQKVQELYSQIEEQIIIYDELRKLAEKLKTNKEGQDFVQFKLDKIVIISDNIIKDLKKKAEQLKSLLTIQLKLTNVNQFLHEIKEKEKTIPDLNLANLTQLAKKLETLQHISCKLVNNKDEQDKVDFLNSKIKIPQIDFETLKEDNLMLTELMKLRDKLIENKKLQDKLKCQYEKNDEENKKFGEQLKEIWVTQKVCPLCKQEIKNK